MPSTRRRTSRTAGRSRITPRAVELYLAGDIAGLDEELGKIAFSDPSPIEATTEHPPAGSDPGLCWTMNWPEARRLRAALQDAAKRMGYAND